MEEKHRQLLLLHRFRLVPCVDRLIPLLRDDEILSVDDVAELRKLTTREATTEKLVDLLVNTKGSKRAFQSLCLALETTYPHILTVMFLGSTGQDMSESTTNVHTSDSEVEELAKHSLDKESFSLDLLPSAHKNFGFQGSSRLFSTPSPLSPSEYETNVAILKELKLISHGRDNASKELKKAHTERGLSSHRLIMSSGDSTLNRIGTLAKQHGTSAGVSNSDKSLSSSRDYDWLKSQCDKAMSELQSLRRQHTETMRRCDSAMKDSEYYRMKHKQAVNKLDKQQTDAMTLRTCYNEVLADKHRLEQEVVNLKKFREEDRVEVAELRKHQQEALSENGNSEAINQLYNTAVKKYESVKDDYDTLRKRYSELLTSRNSAVGKLEPVQEELMQLRKRFEEAAEELENVIRERNGLKQQCTAAIHQWDNALRELNDVKEALAKVQQQRDEAMKEINQAMAVRIKATKDLARLTEERNAAVQEYSLVMLERDSVHKEIEKLQEELGESNKLATNNEQQRQVIVEEVEILRREIASALHDRDRALKECNDLREKYGDYITGREDHGSTRDDVRRDDVARREALRKSGAEGLDRHDSGLSNIGTGESCSKVQKERLENLDQANQEVERLRKQLEKLQLELTEAQQEGEVSKRRRDWAFSERDKIVLERESIRTLCDKLRKERDRAVSDLAEALRDSDDIKKQRNEASKELKELREKFEAQVEKETRMKQLHAIGHNHSRDSAIDADLQEWETETLEFNLSDVNGVGSLGFDLAGGKDDAQYPDSLIFISSIAKGSIAKEKLKVNDMLLQVNNVDLTNADKNLAYEALHSSDGVVNMVIRRRRSLANHFIQAVQLNLTDGRGTQEHGISLETGMYISRIAQGSAAAKEGSISLGDRVFSINGKSLEGMNTPDEGLKLLEGGGEIVTLGIIKCLSNPSASVSSSSSGHNIVENGDGDKMGSPRSSSGGSPVKDSSSRSNIREPVKKLTNSSSQTEDHHLLNKKQTACPSAQQTFLDRAYQKFRERRSNKNSDKKFVSSNSSPSPSHEGEVIAELDSVIDHFKKNSVPSKSSKSRRKKLKEQEKNGGTWPRCKAPPEVYVGQCIGTITTPHKKERKSIASLMNSPKLPPNYGKSCESSEHCIDGHMSSAALSDHGVPYAVFSPPTLPPASTPVSVIHSFNSGPFLSSPKSPFRPPPPTSAKKGAVDAKMTDVSSDQLLSRPLHYSTASSLNSSLDYSVVSANKDVLAYYSNKGKSRPRSALYPQSDTESLRANEISVKPTSIDIQTLCRKPLHVSSSSMSSAHSVLSTPATLSMSPHMSDRATQHSPAAATQALSQTTLYHSPNGIAYYAVPSSRIHYSHAHPHTTISCTSPTMTSPRYSSPSTVSYTSKSGESLLSSSIPESPLSDPRMFHREGYINTSASTSPYSFSNSPAHSIEFYHYHPVPKRIVNKHPHSIHRDDPGFYIPYDVSSTLPKRASQRVQIPTNQNIISRSSMGKISSTSIDKVSVADRCSPMSSFHVEVLNPANSMPTFGDNVIEPGLRSVFIEKSSEPLGIQIDGGPQGGIFVSSVSEHSLAAQAGLRIGDQLLEVCGINMRSATYLLAANVLRQCGNSITMLVQYSPDKYKEIMRTSGSSSNSTSNSSSDASPIPTPTPSNSPKYSDAQNLDETLSLSSLKHHSKASKRNGHGEEHSSASAVSSHEPRRIVLKTKTSNLGISLLGGNAVGIFVHAVQPDSPAGGPNGLRCGDQILEYNGADLRSATAEQAASELAKPAETVSILVQNNYARYLEIQDQAGDSFYLRAMFDRTGESSEELSFRKDDILYVDNTMLNGISGMWRAWLVNEDGQKQRWGIIPSKYKVEEELLLRRSIGDLDSDPSSRRGSTSARRSFFRRKKHQRSNSRDSKELASFSDASINSHSDSGTPLEDSGVVSYQRVERFDYTQLRPILIIGPLIEAVVDKLVQDFPHKFQRCHSELVYASVNTVEKGVQDNVYLDCRRRGSHFECITVAAVKEICDKNTHCIIDVSPQSVERLHRQQIYPIVLFIKFKSTKQIREVKDSTFLTEKLTTKAAKEMYEHSLKVESEYKNLISAVIPGGNLAYMCAQIEACVDQEQSKTLWVSAGTI